MRTCGRWWQFKRTYSRFLGCKKAGPAFRGQPGWIFIFLNRKVVTVKANFGLLMKWLAHLGMGRAYTALIANLHLKTMVSLYTHRMRVKAKFFSVRGVRQMNCNEIPDIWQMAVRSFSRVQSMPSCLYKLYWAHWTKGVNVTSLTWPIEAAYSHTFGRELLSFQINKLARWTNNAHKVGTRTITHIFSVVVLQ